MIINCRFGRGGGDSGGRVFYFISLIHMAPLSKRSCNPRVFISAGCETDPAPVTQLGHQYVVYTFLPVCRLGSIVYLLLRGLLSFYRAPF